MKRISRAKIVSIIVPIYNTAKFLPACLESIKYQTYKNLEIILIDDGSTDKSVAIVDEFSRQDSRVQVIHQPNMGIQRTRYVGLETATGRYVTFLDSDDTISRDFVETMVHTIERTGADIVQCRSSRQLAKLDNGKGETRAFSGQEAFDCLMRFRRFDSTFWGKLYDRDLLIQHNLEVLPGQLYEDTAVMYKILYSAKSVVYLDKILYYYRVNDDGLSVKNFSMANFQSINLYIGELDDFVANYDITIAQSVMNRHKALMYLSIFSRASRVKSISSPDIGKIRQAFLRYAHRSRSFLCYTAIGLVFIPNFFNFVYWLSSGKLKLINQLLLMRFDVSTKA